MILRTELKTWNFIDKLKCISKVVEIKMIVIDESKCKNINDFESLLIKVFGECIEFQGIQNYEKKTQIFEQMRNFLLRVLYKSQKILPFNDPLLTKISTIIPTKFDEERI